MKGRHDAATGGAFNTVTLVAVAGAGNLAARFQLDLDSKHNAAPLHEAPPRFVSATPGTARAARTATSPEPNCDSRRRRAEAAAES